MLIFLISINFSFSENFEFYSFSVQTHQTCSAINMYGGGPPPIPHHQQQVLFIFF